MPIPTKPCEGKLSEETQFLLRISRTGASWGVYPCKTCGQKVGVEAQNGKWMPEKHWPSVIYPPRQSTASRYQVKRYKE